MFNQYLSDIEWEWDTQKEQQDIWQYVKKVTCYMLIEIEISEIKCDFQMQPGLPFDTFIPLASDENGKIAC